MEKYSKTKGVNMLKKRRSFFTTMMGLGLIFSIIIGFLPQPVAAESEATNVILHKIIYPENTPAKEIANEGKEVVDESLMGGRPLGGAEFSLFDVTERFYFLTGAASQSISLAEAQKKIGEEAKSAKEDNQLEQLFGQPIKKAVTDNEGIASFQLTKQTSDGRGKVYLFVETKVPEVVHTSAMNMVLILPLVQEDGTAWTEPIHLYPKNTEYVRDPYFYKHGKNANGEDSGPLAGAIFRLYKLVENEKYYLHENTYNNGNTWVKAGDDGITEFTSAADGKVSTGEHHLPAGTYYFEEVKAPTGYTITDEAKKIQLDIPADPNEQVTIIVNGEKVPMGQAIIYNNKRPGLPNTDGPDEPTPTPDKPSTPSTPGKNIPNLPSTGEVRSGVISVIGLGIILGSLMIYKRKTGGEK